MRRRRTVPSPGIPLLDPLRLAMRQTARREVTPLTEDRKQLKQKQRENRMARATNARKEQDKKSGKVVLPLFRESGKEGALKYDDWRADVDKYLRKGYSNEQVKSAMFSVPRGAAPEELPRL